jgi:hypothetical protein
MMLIALSESDAPICDITYNRHSDDTHAPRVAINYAPREHL